jgi:hypothetical protein
MLLRIINRSVDFLKKKNTTRSKWSLDLNNGHRRLQSSNDMCVISAIGTRRSIRGSDQRDLCYVMGVILLTCVVMHGIRVGV